MIIDKSFEKYLLATLFARFSTDQCRTFEQNVAANRTAENPLQKTLADFDFRYSNVENAAHLYIYLSASPFIYSVMKDLHDCSPANKLTVKSHIVMTLNVIDDLVSKNSDDDRIPADLRRGSNLSRMKNYADRNDIFNTREVRSIVN